MTDDIVDEWELSDTPPLANELRAVWNDPRLRPWLVCVEEALTRLTPGPYTVRYTADSLRATATPKEAES
jgi:hypothetical protein